MAVDALGETVDQPSTELKDPGGAMKILISGGVQETGFHFGSNRAVRQPELGFDGEPHGNIGCSHEHRAAHNSAGTFKKMLERNKDSALSLGDACQTELVAADERDSGEK